MRGLFPIGRLILRIGISNRGMLHRAFARYDGGMSNQRITFEVCIDSVAGALAAKDGGGDRLELCSALSEGGLTPSYGLVQKVVSATDLPVMMMIRPRGDNFVYSPSEIDVMVAEIVAAKSLGVAGVVFGCLDAENEVDINVNRKLLESCGTLSATFHRAFDEVADPMLALSRIRDLGFDRILTSGLAPSAEEGVATIRQLVEASGELVIMPGAGVRPENAGQIIAATGAVEIHGTASEPDLSQPGFKLTSVDIVRAIREQLD